MTNVSDKFGYYIIVLFNKKNERVKFAIFLFLAKIENVVTYPPLPSLAIIWRSDKTLLHVLSNFFSFFSSLNPFQDLCFLLAPQRTYFNIIIYPIEVCVCVVA